jgi:phage-related baseplate assembly protein
MPLPEPSFITRDPAQITSDLIAQYESITGKKLQPAQAERLIIDLIAYRENLIRIAIQEAAKMNLVDYATFPMLDYLGELTGTKRLAAQPARCTVRFTLTAVQTFNVAIPVGTRVETKDGKVIFKIEAAATVTAGQTTVDVSAVAETTGVVGNGYLIGDVNALVDPVAYVASASNTTATSGGADDESDTQYRERIKLAPEKYSNAGPKGAYIYWAKTAHQDIIDVAVTSPSAGVVNVYPLTKNGNPDANMISLVTTTLNSDKIRPLTDQVSVLAPTKIDFSITANVTLFNWADSATATAAINSALATYTAGLKAKLGKDVISAQIIGIINGVYGVYNTALTLKDSVNVAFTDKVLGDSEWANCTATTVTIVGTANG